jgi:hypothetical protein
MPIVHDDRIRETSTTTGTGTFTLSGATTAFRPLSTITSAGSGTLQFYYTIFDNSNFESGIGTYLTTTTFDRTTVISSSNSNSIVNWSSGTKAVILTDNSDFIETHRGCSDTTFTAGENLYQNDTVVVSLDDGKVYRLNPENLIRGTGGWFAGFVVSDAATNTLVQVRNTGFVDTLSGLNTGKTQFAATTRYGKCNIAYVVGGFDGSVYYNTINKITFSTDVLSTATSSLNATRSAQASVSEQITKVYFAGGSNALDVATTYVDIIFFANDSSNAQTTAVLPSARRQMSGCTEGYTKGYFIAGADAVGLVSTAFKITFSSDLISSQTSADISVATRELASVSDGSTKGFHSGGQSGKAIGLATSNKITFATDLNNARSTANLSQARYALAGLSEGRSKGYFAGGNSGSEVATSDLLLFSTESNSANTSSNLSQGRINLSGTSQGSTHGYYCGGYTGLFISVATSDKTLFSTDITAASTATNLATARHSTTAGGCDAGRSLPTTEYPDNVPYILGIAISATTMIIDSEGNKKPYYTLGQKGYFLGGTTGAAVATGDRLTFSTDTTAAVTTSNLSAATAQMNGVSQGSYAGYVTGGVTASAILNKTTYSTDTTASISSATKTAISRLDMAGLSFPFYKGYFLGGRSAASTLVSTANKFLYNSETNIVISTASLSTVRDKTASVSEGTIKGYVCGGASNTTPTRVATTDKLTFSSDATSATTTANLSQARQDICGFSFTLRSGYIGGGDTGAAVATTDKLTFSTDSTAALTTGNLSQARSGYGTMSENSFKGYFCGGITTAGVATGDRMLFSTETTAAQASANLSQARYYMASFSDVGV